MTCDTGMSSVVLFFLLAGSCGEVLAGGSRVLSVEVVPGESIGLLLLLGLCVLFTSSLSDNIMSSFVGSYRLVFSDATSLTSVPLSSGVLLDSVNGCSGDGSLIFTGEFSNAGFSVLLERERMVQLLVLCSVVLHVVHQ